MLKEAGLGDGFWGKAMLAAAFIKNRVLHAANKHNETPYELMFGTKPDVSNMRIFGCRVFYHNEDPNIGKLEDRGLKGIFVGYSQNVKGHVIYDVDKRKFMVSRSVKFLEKPKASGVTVIDEIMPNSANKPDIAPRPAVDHQQDQPPPRQDEQEQTEPKKPGAVSVANIRNDRRERRPPGEWWKASSNIAVVAEVDYAFIADSIDEIIGIAEGVATPTSYLEASKQDVWRVAMQEEYDALQKNGTWELVKLPNGRKAIGSKWVYKAKENEKGEVIRYKARLVARGFTQQQGIDFKETYAPVTKLTTIRTMLAVAALKDYRVEHLDVSNAYLNADVEEELYMEQPEGFVQCDENGNKLVCKLIKSLYGLKQAGRNWNIKINKWLCDNNFMRSKVHVCMCTANLAII
jgi:hypothetical protein